jgi:hypothetical protein
VNHSLTVKKLPVRQKNAASGSQGGKTRETGLSANPE